MSKVRIYDPLSPKEIERRLKISMKLKGIKKNPFSEEHKHKIRISKIGRKMLETHKSKLSSLMKGNKRALGSKHTEEWKEKARQRTSSKKGVPNINFKGDKNPRWKGGITPLYLQIRHHLKSRQWSSDCFTRDDFTCQECGIRGGKLCCHHIKYFSEIIKSYKIKTLGEALNCEELWNINNGVTICQGCHIKIHTKNGK